MRGRAIVKQAWYAVFRHIRVNPETRSTETYPYRCTLSTLPADGTLALERPPRGGSSSGDGQTLGTGVVVGEPGFDLGERGRRDRFGARRGESLFSLC